MKTSKIQNRLKKSFFNRIIDRYTRKTNKGDNLILLREINLIHDQFFLELLCNTKLR